MRAARFKSCARARAADSALPYREPEGNLRLAPEHAHCAEAVADAGKRLTATSDAYGGYYLYLGDEGIIYGANC